MLYFLFHPILGFLLNLLVALAVALVPSGTNLPAFLVFVSPWLFLIVVIMNLPLFGAAFRLFHLPEEVRFNHALEHGTIYFLRRRYGKRFKIGGRAETRGFRLNGLPSDEFVAPGFEELREHLGRGRTRAVISKHCGSMIVTAQALAALLFMITVISFVVFGMTTRRKVSLLGTIVLVYLLLRHAAGWILQRRLFLSVDFSDASITSILRVPPAGPLERQQVYFVRTTVRKQEPP
jgi:hypothetical protein